VGVFIKLAGPGGERIAIRHDGVLLWRRRLLPITTVASVFPEQRAVVLNVDRRTLGSTMAVPDAVAATPLSAEEGADFSGEWQERIARYVSPGKSEADQANADRADAASKPSAESAGLERPVMGAARQPTPEPTQSDQRSAARHLLFVSSSRGYRSSSWRVRLRPSARTSRYLSTRVPSWSPSWVPHHFRTIRGSAPTSSRPSSPYAQAPRRRGWSVSFPWM